VTPVRPSTVRLNRPNHSFPRIYCTAAVASFGRRLSPLSALASVPGGCHSNNHKYPTQIRTPNKHSKCILLPTD
jgi:hypothetical protein